MFRTSTDRSDPAAAPLAATTARRQRWWHRLPARLLHGDGAAISPMFALLLVPIAGSIAYAVELGGMQYVQRSAQNAADAAALAAASNNSDVGTTFLMEARAAARPYGYVDGSGDVTVDAAVTPCPVGTIGAPTCYEAVITTSFPLTFSRVIGFLGSDGSGSQAVAARAVATSAGGGGTWEDVCVMALSSTGTALLSNGGPRPDMAGCTLFSNSDMTCNGHDLGADFGVAVGTNNGCAVDDPPGRRIDGATPIDDPYSDRADNIPANTCPSLYPSGTYPQLPTKGSDPSLPARNLLSGSKSWTGNQQFCGDVQLTGDVTLTGTNTTIVVQNGRLDLHGWTIRTATGAAATIVFSGDNGSYQHYPVNAGFPAGTKGSGPATIDIVAPSAVDDPWRGVAIYQDPALNTGVSFTEAGNDPTWNITGLAYFPKADIGFSGIVSKASNGTQCFVLVAYTVTIGGTAQILANTECDALGLAPPQVQIGTSGTTRPKLVS